MHISHPTPFRKTLGIPRVRPDVRGKSLSETSAETIRCCSVVTTALLLRKMRKIPARRVFPELDSVLRKERPADGQSTDSEFSVAMNLQRKVEPIGRTGRLAQTRSSLED